MSTPRAASSRVSEVVERLATVRDRIAGAGGDVERVTVIGVTKGFGAETAGIAVAAGLQVLGENYAQELLAKSAAVDLPVSWHFLGGIQRNKIAALSPVVAAWHGVDRSTVVDSLARVAPGARVFIQVNLAGAANRPGCAWSDVSALTDRAREAGLAVLGLMGVAPRPEETGGPEAARPLFARLARARDACGLDGLSMGMSDDFEAAVAEGATVLRLGRVLFGPRAGGPGMRR